MTFSIRLREMKFPTFCARSADPIGMSMEASHTARPPSFLSSQSYAPSLAMQMKWQAMYGCWPLLEGPITIVVSPSLAQPASKLKGGKELARGQLHTWRSFSRDALRWQFWLDVSGNSSVGDSEVNFGQGQFGAHGAMDCFRYKVLWVCKWDGERQRGGWGKLRK